MKFWAAWGGDLVIEGKHLVAHEANQVLAGEAARPCAPAHAFLGHGLDVFGRRVQGILKRPVASEDAGVGPAGAPGPQLVVLVDVLDQVEEEQVGELLGVAQRVRVAARPQVIADLVDPAAHRRRERHGLGSPQCSGG
jgi:hypothetical protein